MFKFIEEDFEDFTGGEELCADILAMVTDFTVIHLKRLESYREHADYLGMERLEKIIFDAIVDIGFGTLKASHISIGAVCNQIEEDLGIN